MKNVAKKLILALATIGALAACGGQNPIAKYPALQSGKQSTAQLFTTDSEQPQDINVGGKGSAEFNIRSAFRNSDVKVTGVRMNDTDKTALTFDKDSNTYSVTKDGVSVTMTCADSEADLQKELGCDKKSCAKTCTAQLQSTCATAEGTVELVISTESVAGTTKSDRDLSEKIDLKGQAKKCPKGSKS